MSTSKILQTLWPGLVPLKMGKTAYLRRYLLQIISIKNCCSLEKYSSPLICSSFHFVNIYIF